MAENPYRRLRELTKTSQKDFGEKYGFSKTTLIQIESGQYVDLSDAMILSLGEECVAKDVDARQVLADEYNAQTLQDAYHTWQSNERMMVAHLFQIPFSPESGEHSPFHHFIVQIAGTRQKFCKTLKVPAATVMRYADGVTDSMPKAIKDALLAVSFPYITELEQAQDLWNSK